MDMATASPMETMTSPRSVLYPRLHPHRGHADVVHRGYARAHEEAAHDQLPSAHLFSADGVEGHS